jgi:hypothetical protein
MLRPKRFSLIQAAGESTLILGRRAFASRGQIVLFVSQPTQSFRRAQNMAPGRIDGRSGFEPGMEALQSEMAQSPFAERNRRFSYKDRAVSGQAQMASAWFLCCRGMDTFMDTAAPTADNLAADWLRGLAACACGVAVVLASRCALGTRFGLNFTPWQRVQSSFR